MGKTEEAVDGAVELKDFAEDIAQTLGTLQTETFDDDELLEELEAMQVGDEIELDATDKTPVAAAPVVMPAAIAVAIDPSSYPKVPSKIIERRKLLSDDSAAEAPKNDQHNPSNGTGLPDEQPAGRKYRQISQLLP